MTFQLPAISLTDPWATLVVAGIKTLETRKGPVLSGFTGPLVICRTKANCDPYDLAQFGVAMPAKPYTEDDRGMAIGVVLVGATFRASGLFWSSTTGVPGELERQACFRGLEGRYFSELTAAAWFPRPVAAKGKQGRFKVDVPAEYLPDWARR